MTPKARGSNRFSGHNSTVTDDPFWVAETRHVGRYGTVVLGIDPACADLQELGTLFAEDWNHGNDNLMRKSASADGPNDGGDTLAEAADLQKGRSTVRIDPKADHGHGWMLKWSS
jgi:hypothetical protein